MVEDTVTKNERPLSAFLSHPYLSALAVFIVALMVCASLLVYEANRLKSLKQYNALTEMLAIKAKLESAMKSHAMVLWSLHTNLLIEPDLSSRRFDSLAQGLLRHDTQLQGVAWIPAAVIDDDFETYFGIKIYGDGLDNLKPQMRKIRQAIDQQKLILSGPTKNALNRDSLFGFLPVFEGDRLLGIVAAAIDHMAMLSYSGVDSPNLPDTIALRWLSPLGRSATVFYGREQVFDHSSVQLNVDLPYGRWLLAADVDGDGWSRFATRLAMAGILCVFVSLVLAIAAYAVARSYARREQAIESANYRANYDALTGLINRHFFASQLQQAINQHDRLQRKFCLMFIDLDYFKQVNDTWGHSAGDELLKEFANRLISFVRKSDVVARLAGDEFVVLTSDCENITKVDILANRILDHLSSAYDIKGKKLAITCSIGIAVYPDDGVTAEAILSHSDTAMYAAKKAGRNRVTFFNEAMRDEAQQQLALHNEIIDGIKNNEFVVFYQPIMNISSQGICKCEALVRWQHPSRGLIGPMDFIPIAENTGAIRPLGRWVLERVCRDYKTWKDAGLDLTVSVNRSVSEFYPSGSHREWIDLVAGHGISPSSIIFEITESLFMDGNDAPVDELKDMRSNGFRFAIDDFGTGFSAINYLRHYPVDYLKIDRSFISDLNQNRQDRTLVEVIIKMGQAMDMEVIAEGVEDGNQLLTLSELNCDFVQGYHLAKPKPLDEFIVFCQEFQAAKNPPE